MGFERVSCNYCGSEDQAMLYEIHESPDDRQPPTWRGESWIPVVRCKRCDLVFLNPRYDHIRLTALYQDPQMYTGTIDPNGNERNIAQEYTQRLKGFRQDVRSLHRFISSGRLLDIGCGLGYFIEALGKSYDAVGLEWSRASIETLCVRQLRAVVAKFPDHPFKPGQFEVVTLLNVLDHLPNPMLALRAIHNLLVNGGLIMLTLINISSLAARVYGAGFRLLGPNHLYYFSPSTIRRYLSDAGFRLVNIEYPYFGTQFADPLRHAYKLAKDWCTLRVLGKKAARISPPFYGNTMRLFAVRST